ncbi:hypothetical protein QR680_000090 [Steinernema hermaphroditum]|uniref:Uncharacterized protein n=1 Tax=Steinernema hermaphroditum TaxID=289476 RepID=A0AA39GTI1_9BILA|nr:hypothetical protein QR680_000090 [Steinernema hermaphroditum]
MQLSRTLLQATFASFSLYAGALFAATAAVTVRGTTGAWFLPHLSLLVHYFSSSFVLTTVCDQRFDTATVTAMPSMSHAID